MILKLIVIINSIFLKCFVILKVLCIDHEKIYSICKKITLNGWCYPCGTVGVTPMYGTFYSTYICICQIKGNVPHIFIGLECYFVQKVLLFLQIFLGAILKNRLEAENGYGSRDRAGMMGQYSLYSKAQDKEAGLGWSGRDSKD